MKKLWIALLGTILVLSTLIGAQRTSASQAHSAGTTTAKAELSGCTAKGTVSYMFWGDKSDDAAQLASIKRAEKDCKGLKVNPIWDSVNYDMDLAMKVGSGNAPDLFQLDAPMHIPEYVSEGFLAPLDSFIKKDKLNMNKVFFSQCVKEMTYRGHTYGLPRTCSNQSLLFYNREMFQARKVNFPTNKWTYTNLAKAAAKLSGKYSLPHDPTAQLRFGIGLNTDAFRTEQFIWDWGGDWLNSKLNKCTMTSPQARAGLQFFHDMAYKYHGMPIAAQASGLPDYFTSARECWASVQRKLQRLWLTCRAPRCLSSPRGHGV
jgi:multiple sugar transport system substrate-binding protein